MQLITFQGLRGGTGTSSIVAMTADALHRQDQHVLMVDTNPDDTLRLFFNIPHTDPCGWAAALGRQLPWHEQAYHIDTGLELLPYGRFGLEHSLQYIARGLQDPAAFWLKTLEQLEDACTWLLMDLPARSTRYAALQARAQADIRVASVDAGCHVLLAQTDLPPESRLLASLFDPSRPLCNDILLEWRHHYPERLIPAPMHRDEAVHEALASKTTVQMLHPHSVGSSDAASLATWLMAQAGLHR